MQIPRDNTYLLRLAVLALTAMYVFFYATTAHNWHFIDNVNLVIHEAGHVLFMPFGAYIHVLGGTILQLLVPSLFTVYFFMHDELFSASLVLFWVGQNSINISVYMADAERMILPLLGGDAVTHDWHYLFGTTGLLPYTETLAMLCYMAGVSICAIATILGTQHAKPHTKNNAYPQR